VAARNFLGINAYLDSCKKGSFTKCAEEPQLRFFRIFGEGVTGITRAIGDWISGRMEDAQTQQIEPGAAVHGALDEFQAVDMTFDGTVAPGLFESGEESGLVTA
jgi:hypothetical protein